MSLRSFVERYWPHMVAALMIGYVIVLVALVKAEMARTDAILRWS